MLSHFKGKRVLLLQGPMGPFFWRLRKDLEAAGADVHKVNLCAGDQFFYPRKAHAFRGTLEGWPQFLTDLIATHRFDAVMLFGDCRPYHIIVPHVLRFLKVQIYVFEEGYLRPDFLTIERGGVNNFSSLPRDASFYRRYEPSPEEAPAPGHAPHSFFWWAVFAIVYAVANFAFAWRYPRYQHHRPLNPFHQGFLWARSAWRKLWFRFRERNILHALNEEKSGRYFLVPLQVHTDSQLLVHSRFITITEFIELVLRSFAEYAEPDQCIVFKHHPMDRGHVDYGRVLKRLAEKYQLEGRVIYVHDLHLPTLLDHARGTVVINSTVGLSSVLHKTPVCVLGDSVYDLPGLTHQGSLDGFWNDPGVVDYPLFQRFRAWLLAHNQANGSFHQRLPGSTSHTGVRWPPRLGVEVVDRIRVKHRAHEIQPHSIARPPERARKAG